MHLLGICVLLVFLLFTNLASDLSRSDDYYYDYDSEQERTDEPLRVSTRDPGTGLRGSNGTDICSAWSSRHQEKSKTGPNLSTLLRWG